MDRWQQFFQGDMLPTLLFGNLSFALLTLSMMMRNIVWLRVLAIASALATIYYRSVFVFDPVSIVWQVIFISVNVIQLAIIAMENRRIRLENREQDFLNRAFPQVRKSSARALLTIGKWVELAKDSLLTVQGGPVNRLQFVSAGRVRIEKDGVPVAICGPGDFVGEMSFITGEPATATAIADDAVTILAFERPILHKLLDADTELRLALETSFNRNLVEKLAKSNAAKSTSTQPGPAAPGTEQA
ncbi:MAG: cyclic nucleotide-binding domain-containing protein [Alphaproteobacteria bacterium]|nr:cyclic nucleotide-binding domain-containing protein [Alphaproteobacteria bacterium]